MNFQKENKPFLNHSVCLFDLIQSEHKLVEWSKYYAMQYIKYIQGVQEKLCFFTIHCNNSLAYIAVRDL